MRLSNSYFFTIRENVKDEESTSGNLLTRAGMIKKSSSGIYMYLPLGLMVLKNIEQVIREEMNAINCQELLMPTLIPEEIYEKSGRRSGFGNSMFSLLDRFDKPYALGPTHEELFTIAGMMHTKSYKDLPFSLYQFQTKFRDEARPRYGLIRVREFIMKDAYTFDTDYEGLDKSYEAIYNAYKKIFARLGIDYKIVTADTGVMGGMLSEEWQAVTDIGEDVLVLCDNCSYASNIEVAECVSQTSEDVKPLHKELIHTPDAKTIEEVSSFLNQDAKHFVKTLIYQIDNKEYALLVRGDHEVNETKVRKLLKATSVELANAEIVEKITSAKVGFAGPIGLNIPVIADNEVMNLTNFIVGANETDYHYKNVNIDDFKYLIAADIRNIKEGDKCPSCGGTIYFKKGIEIGNTFKLGTKYSEALGLYYLDQNNKLNPVVMGSHGIGLGRCLAAIAEQKSDANGLVWPVSVAPFQVALVLIDKTDEKQLEVANHLYKQMQSQNIKVLYDDRDERPGVKFKDMDLIGIPIRITVGKKVNEQLVELKFRTKELSQDVTIFDVIDLVLNITEE